MSGSLRRLGLTLACAALAIAAGLVPGSERSMYDPLSGCVPDELFVKFLPGADPAVVSARHGGSIKSEIGFIGVHVVSIPTGTAAEKIPAFQADAEVEYAEPVGVVTIPESPPSGPGACGPS